MCTRQADHAERRFATPWGEGAITVRDGRLVALDLPTAGGETEVKPRPETALSGQGPARAAGGARVTGAAEALADEAAADKWAEQLAAYFRGERLLWTAEEVGLDDLAVGPFARRVYATLLTVPPAVTVSYGELAEKAGHPRAARAVGTAMACNPIPIVIPCHRVVRGNGSLGDYGNDPALKERLLEHERNHNAVSEGEV